MEKPRMKMFTLGFDENWGWGTIFTRKPRRKWGIPPSFINPGLTFIRGFSMNEYPTRSIATWSCRIHIPLNPVNDLLVIPSDFRTKNSTSKSPSNHHPITIPSCRFADPMGTSSAPLLPFFLGRRRWIHWETPPVWNLWGSYFSEGKYPNPVNPSKIWMVYFRGKHIPNRSKTDDDWGYHHDFGKFPTC